MVITSKRSFRDWGQVFSDPVLATATLDRLLHYSTTLNIKAESYRLNKMRRPGLSAEPAPRYPARRRRGPKPDHRQRT